MAAFGLFRQSRYEKQHTQTLCLPKKLVISTFPILKPGWCFLLYIKSIGSTENTVIGEWCIPKISKVV